ncbi:MAG: peptide chain release factor N(5)-glutamine methyltransferase [Candidatus Eremiobacteraeota bacterium]|nr:peptide chain release factor N(5)-glutamine methyltransferase [Candidatus Eremiobacteraeota bacterium]
MTTVAALLSESPPVDAALLLAHVLQRNRAWLAAHADAEASQEEAARFRVLCARRRKGVPIAYLLGTAGFYGREFFVNEDVLVPRPETEHLIDAALAFIKGPMRVLDVGTGSGAIACTIAAETQAIVDATDASNAALDVARENSHRLGLSDRCRFYHGDLVAPVQTNRYDVIVANLPYIPTRDVPKPPDPVSFEPRLATDGGPDGLSLYRRLIPSLPEVINEEGLVLLEAAPPTITELASMLRSTFPNFTISVEKDYAGLDRYVKAFGQSSSGLRAG